MFVRGVCVRLGFVFWILFVLAVVHSFYDFGNNSEVHLEESPLSII